MHLKELQHGFQRHLLTGDPSLLKSIADAPPLPPAARAAIYANAYRARLLDALDDTYSMVHRVLGDDLFTALGHAFIEEHPSRYRSIRWYGRELPEALARLAPYAEQPILAELALFEWTLTEVFDAADAAVVDRGALQAVAPDHWPSLRLTFHPSLRRLPLAWNTVAVWRALDQDAEPPSPEAAPAPVTWLLWRQELKNRFRSLDDAEAASLDAALNGGNFADICAVLRTSVAEEEVPLRAAILIATWADSGILVSVDAG